MATAAADWGDLLGPQRRPLPFEVALWRVVKSNRTEAKSKAFDCLNFKTRATRNLHAISAGNAEDIVCYCDVSIRNKSVQLWSILDASVFDGVAWMIDTSGWRWSGSEASKGDRCCFAWSWCWWLQSVLFYGCCSPISRMIVFCPAHLAAATDTNQYKLQMNRI